MFRFLREGVEGVRQRQQVLHGKEVCFLHSHFKVLYKKKKKKKKHLYKALSTASAEKN